MARPPTRTVEVQREVREQVLAIFGSAAHAQRVLGLVDLVPYDLVARALQGKPTRSDVAGAIEGRWADWLRGFLFEQNEKAASSAA